MTESLSPRARSLVYWFIFLVGMTLGSISAFYGAIDGKPRPDWLNGALAAYAFMAGGFGFTAASHTPSPHATVDALTSAVASPGGVVTVTTASAPTAHTAAVDNTPDLYTTNPVGKYAEP